MGPCPGRPHVALPARALQVPGAGWPAWDPDPVTESGPRRWGGPWRGGRWGGRRWGPGWRGGWGWLGRSRTPLTWREHEWVVSWKVSLLDCYSYSRLIIYYFPILFISHIVFITHGTDQIESIHNRVNILIFALLLIYILLASLFYSLLNPCFPLQWSNFPSKFDLIFSYEDLNVKL